MPHNLGQKYRPPSAYLVNTSYRDVDNNVSVSDSNEDVRLVGENGRHGNLSLRKRSSRLITSFPPPSATPSRAPSPSQAQMYPDIQAQNKQEQHQYPAHLQQQQQQHDHHHHHQQHQQHQLHQLHQHQHQQHQHRQQFSRPYGDVSRSRSVHDMMHQRPCSPKAPNRRVQSSEQSAKHDHAEEWIHEKCELKIQELTQQLAESAESVNNLRRCLALSNAADPETTSRAKQDEKDHLSYAFTVTDAEFKADDLLADEEDDEVQDWGFCYVDQGSRLHRDGEALACAVPAFASRLGFDKPMTAQRRNRQSAVIGDNILYISEIPRFSNDSGSASSPASQHSSTAGSVASNWSTDMEIEKTAEVKAPVSPATGSGSRGMAVSVLTGPRKTREEPSERAMSCEVNTRENRTFDNPLGGRQSYVNRKFRAGHGLAMGRSSVAAYRA